MKYTLSAIENIYSKIYMFKDNVQNIIINSMEENNANVAISMIYGDTTNLDESIQENFEAVGVSHLMSVSGTHITSFMLIINVIIGMNRNIEKKNVKTKRNRNGKDNIIKFVIQIVCVILYIIFTGFSVSVIRAGVMLIVSIIYGILDKRKNKYHIILITFLIMLFYNPYVIFNTGARLSFLATLGITLFAKHIYEFFQNITAKLKNEIIKRVIEYITKSISITIAVQMMIIPIQMKAFNKLPFPVIIPNLILGLISTPIRVLGTIGIMVSFIPSFSKNIFSLIELFVRILIYLAKIFKTISFSISTVSQPFVFFSLYYLVIVIIYMYFKLNTVQNKEGKYNFKKLLKYLKIFAVIVLTITISFAIVINIYSIYFSKYVYFFNVEQGDMSYIKHEATSVIVDIGSLSNNLSFNVISNYFKANNLNKVDVVIISHMHKDHVNGLENFIQNYEVGMVLYAKPKVYNDAFKNFKEILNKYDVESKEVKAGDIINIGKIEIQVLLPDNEYIDSSDEVNANSLVFKIIVNNKELLYMGDASIETEEKLIDKIAKDNIDIQSIYVLKVGHHGSKTATSEEFIQKIQPKNAVISALKKYYGHPHQDTLDTLKENEVYVYLTEQHGAIKFKLN